MVLVEVAALLRAGLPTSLAWQRVLGRRCLGPQADGSGQVPGSRWQTDAGQSPGGQVSDGQAPNGQPCTGQEPAAAAPAPLLALAQSPPRRWLPYRHGGSWRWTPPWPRRRAEREQARRQAARGAVAACRLAEAVGAPLANVLEAVAGAVSEAGRAQSMRDTALAGPRSTARLLAALPAAAPVLGTAVGADLWAYLFSGPLAVAVLVSGVVLMGIGHLLTQRLLAAAQAGDGVVDEALGLDLARAALVAGATVPGTLAALGEVLDDEGLVVVSRALLLGADWPEAWEAASEVGGEQRHEGWAGPESQLASCLRVAWEEGASPVPLLERAASAVREGRAAAAQEAAERLAVRLVLPLGLCHLPAFVLLGVVPVVLDVGGSMLRGG